MNAEIGKMMGRFQKTGMVFVKEGMRSLEMPMVQYAIAGILILYMTFLESDTESVLSLAMTNPLGRLAVLLVLLFLSNVSVPIGILFGVLIVMSCSNAEPFVSEELKQEE